MGSASARPGSAKASLNAPASPAELPEIPGYRIVRLLRAGGMGSVYVAERTTTHETFAVKFLHKHLAADQGSVARFDREIQTLRDIRHPNVVQVFDWSLPTPGKEGQGYVVMELLHGETLQERLRREQVLVQREAVTLMLQVLDGLAAAHALGILHRDLGPSNIFLENRPDDSVRAKLIDFGLARSFTDTSGGSVTQPGTLMGKPAYVAPEVFHDRPAEAPADVFACGMILYRMLAGRLPFEAVSSEMLWVERFVERKAHREYPSPARFEPTIPAPLADVVGRALRLRVEERVASARELQRLLLELEPTLSSEIPSTSLRRVRTLQEAARSLSKEPTAEVRRSVEPRPRARTRLRVAIAATVVLGLAGLLWFAFGGRGADREAAETDAALAAATRSDAGGGGPAPTDAAPGEEAGAEPVENGDVVVAAADGASAPSVDAVPATVTVAVLDLPAGAEVRWNGAKVDRLPLQVPRSELAVELEVVVRGYARFRQLVTPDRDVALVPELRPLRGGDGRRRDAGGAVVRIDAGTQMMTKFE